MVNLPGTAVTIDELRELGFHRHRLEIVRVSLPGGTGCEWNTLGAVPDAPGLYAFTVEADELLHVAYVGLTTNLWMVTKGCMPGVGQSRPAQRYGRHRYAGATRQRVNEAVGEQLRAGRTVSHWLRPTAHGATDAATKLALATEESALIARWSLQTTGWNRRG